MHACCQARIEPKYIIMVFAAVMLLERLVHDNSDISLTWLKHLKTVIIYQVSNFEVVVIY